MAGQIARLAAAGKVARLPLRQMSATSERFTNDLVHTGQPGQVACGDASNISPLLEIVSTSRIRRHGPVADALQQRPKPFIHLPAQTLGAARILQGICSGVNNDIITGLPPRTTRRSKPANRSTKRREFLPAPERPLQGAVFRSIHSQQIKVLPERGGWINGAF